MRCARDRPRVLAAAAWAAALVAVFGLWVATGLGGARTVVYVDDLATVAAALAAAALSARAAVRSEPALRLHWWLLAGACAAWTLGEALWGWYDLVRGDVPVTSWADAGYLAAIPLAGAALLVHPACRGRVTGRTRSVLDGLVVAASMFLIAWMLVLEPVHRTDDLTSLAGLVTSAYPVGDVVLVVLVVLVVRGTTSGERLELWWLLGGLLAISVSDAVYAYLADVARFTTGNAIDTGWFAGYLAIAVAAHCARTGREAREPRPDAAPALSTAAIVAPFLPLLGALGLTAVRMQLGHRPDRVGNVLALALVALVLLRQLLLVLDLLFPGDRDEEPPGGRLVSAIGVAADRRGWR